MEQLHHPHLASTTYLRYDKREQGRRQKTKNEDKGYSMYEIHQNSSSAPPARNPRRFIVLSLATTQLSIVTELRGRSP